MSPRPLWRFPRGDRDARPPRPAAAWSVTPRPLREWSSLTSTPSVRQPGERRPERGITVRSQCGEWGLFIIVNIVANEFPNMKTKTSLRERHAPCWLFALVTSCAMTGTDPSLPRTWRLGFNYRADRSQSQTGDQGSGYCDLSVSGADQSVCSVILVTDISRDTNGANIAITDTIRAIC